MQSPFSLRVLICEHMLLHLPDHHQPRQHLVQGELVEQLGGVPDWRVGDTIPLGLKIEHVIPVLHRLRAFAQVELVQFDRTSERILVVFMLFIHLSVIVPLSLGRWGIVSQEHCSLLLASLDHV